MNLPELATRRPVTITMVTVAILLFGSVSLSRLKLNLLPDLSYPSLTIRTEYTGAAPSEMETLITKPVEEAVGVIRHVRQVRSVSRAGQSDVLLEFAWGTNMDNAVLDVREKIDALTLPQEVRRPLVLRFDPASDPVARLGLALGSDSGALGITELKDLRRVAEQRIQKILESVEGIAAVKISGGLEDEIHILVDQQRLAQFNLSVSNVIDRVRRENVNLSGGRVEEGTLRYLVRTLNQFRSLEDIAKTILTTRDGKSVYVQDVARIEAGFREREAIIRIDGAQAVEIAIYKEGDANTVAVARRLRERLEQVTKSLPKRYELITLYDQSIFITGAVNNVFRAGGIGALFAILILYFFLGNTRSTAIIAVAIPVSIVATFNMMYAAELTLNIMSLGGLALAVGLLVDNAIVVLENIFRHREQGVDPVAAARTGAGEVSGAVTAATLTTVAVFLPMVFVEGVAGQLFSDQALVISFALIASLLVALSVIPMLAARRPPGPDQALGVLSRPSRPAPGNALQRAGAGVVDLFLTFGKLAWRRRPLSDWAGAGRLKRAAYGLYCALFWFLPFTIVFVLRWTSALVAGAFGFVLRPAGTAFRRAYAKLEQVYVPLLDWSLCHRLPVLGIAAGLFALSLALLPRIGAELIPTLVQGEFRVELGLPAGTPLARTDQLLRQIQRRTGALEGVARTYAVAGTGNRLNADPDAAGENVGILNVVMRAATSAADEARVTEQIRTQLAGIPGLDTRFARPTLFSLKNPLEVEIAGYNLAALKTLSDRLIDALAGDPRFADPASSMASGRPEIQIRFRHDRAAGLGLLSSEIADRVVKKVRGEVATRYRLADREIDVVVRARQTDRNSMAGIRRLIVNPQSPRPVRLDTVAEVEEMTGAAEIRRIDQQRVALVSASLAKGDLAGGVEALRDTLARLVIPEGASARVSGQNEEMQRSFRSLRLALLLAVFMIYLVMASKFESLRHPFVIFFTIPLALTGSIFALYVTGAVLSVVVFIGLIVLTGIVVNNGIVLIDFINRLRAEGEPRMSAIRTAAHVRLRPIVMTTLTTTLGLLPLALGVGEGVEIRAPMAITVIGGLLVSTLLTLVVLPVMYTFIDREQ